MVENKKISVMFLRLYKGDNRHETNPYLYYYYYLFLTCCKG